MTLAELAAYPIRGSRARTGHADETGAVFAAAAAKRTVLAAVSVILLVAVSIAAPAGGAPPDGRDHVDPTAPQNLHVTAAAPSVVYLAWDPAQDNIGVAGYYVWGDTGRATVWTDTDRATVSDPSYVVDSLGCGQSTPISIVAFDAAGNRSPRVSTTVSTAACPDVLPPSTPSGFRQAATAQDAVVLAWDASTDNVGVVGYGIYQNLQRVLSPVEPTITLSGLSCGSKSMYSIDAVDAAGNRSPLGSVYVQTAACSPSSSPADTTPPSAPTGLAASSITQTGLTLSWSPATDNVGVAGYDVYRNSTKVASVSTTSSSQTGLSCGTSYAFAVAARDAAGNASQQAQLNVSTAACSPSSSLADTTPPSAPTGLGIPSVSRTSVLLTWGSSTDNVGVAGYQTYVNGSPVSTTTQLGATVSSLTCGTAYTFEVDAFDAAGNQSTRASVTGSTAACPDTQPPTAPTNVIASSRTATSIALSWAASSDNVGVTGYGLYRGGALVGNTSGTTTGIFSGLACSTNYTLAADAYDAAGNRSSQTVVMVSTTACPDTTPPSTPTGLATSNATQTGAALAWTASTDNVGVAGYDLYVNGSKAGSATGTSYSFTSLTCGTSYTLGVVAYDPAGNRSSQATATASTSACSTPLPSSSFPSSFYNGPLGSNNILPSKNPGALLGTWAASGNPGTQREQYFANRESQIGRKFDLYASHYAAPNGACDYGNGYSPFTSGEEQWADSTGHIVVVNWTHGWTIDEVNQGKADACLAQFGQRAAAFGHRFLLRIYWEFNGTWMHWSSKGQPFIDAWRRTVTKIKDAGGTNAGFIWSPDSGERDAAFASYPGDGWVDWVGISAYNFNKSGAWCSAFNPGPWCELREVLSYDPVKYPTIYDTYAAKKPFILGENGTVEDPNTSGRKGQWFRNAATKLSAELTGVRALTYFDADVTASEGFNWRIDTSTSSVDGFRYLASQPFFNTR